MNFRNYLFTALFTAATCALLLPLKALAGPCDAYFPFDGNVADAGPNGYDGLLITKGGKPATGSGKFVKGKHGQALHLTGQTAVRVPLDLNPDACPQITITAWVKFEDSPTKGFQYLVSTGRGDGPKLVREGLHFDTYGAGGRIKEKRALRAGQWIFIASTWDYKNRTMKMYWRNRSRENAMAKRKLGNVLPDFWIGANNDGMRWPVAAAMIDDVRIYGRLLSGGEIKQFLRAWPSKIPGDPLTPTTSTQISDSMSTQSPLPAGYDMDTTNTDGVNDVGVGDATSEKNMPALDGSSRDAGDASSPYPIGQTPDFELQSRLDGSDTLMDEAREEDAERRKREEFQAIADQHQKDLLAQAAAEEEALAQAEADAAATPSSGLTSSRSQALEEAGGKWFYPVGDPVLTERSGLSGSIKKVIDLADEGLFISMISWKEKSDRPCRVRIAGYYGPASGEINRESRSVSFGCGRPGGYDFTVKTGPSHPISNIRVCNNSRNAKLRLKGIRIGGVEVLSNGTLITDYVSDEEELSHCYKRSSVRSCPGQMLATGVVVMANDAGGDRKADITGLKLICRAFEIR